MQACTKTHHYEIKMQKISGEGDTGHPLHRPHPLGAYGTSIFLRTYGAQAQRDTPEKNPSYGLVLSKRLYISSNVFHRRVAGPF